MQHFQKNPDLSEQEIKVRLYAMMVMGSILGDGSDFRQPLAAERGRKFLNNPRLCAFFSQPKAFTPLKFPDGDGYDQRMAFYSRGDSVLLGLFNFSNHEPYRDSIRLEEIGVKKGRYAVKDFITGAPLGTIEKEQEIFTVSVAPRDALMVRFIPD
jgi:hypothetical protein